MPHREPVRPRAGDRRRRRRAAARRWASSVDEDDAAGPAGAGSGNLLARIPGRGERTILLCAHLDTVEQSAPIEPVLVDDGWENANDGILGADNKAAIAVMLEVARRATIEGSPVGIELLFTVAEENGLLGAKAFDVSKLTAELRLRVRPRDRDRRGDRRLAQLLPAVAPSSTAAPRTPASARRTAAAPSSPPPTPSPAMPLGRIDPETTANVGSITGGVGSTNVVPERGEAARRGALAQTPSASRTVIAKMVDAVYDGAAAAECDVDVVTERLFAGYRQKPSSPAVVAAEGALRACGYEPRRIATGGASDANALEASGFTCVNLANGTEHNHEPTERVSVAALDGMLDVALALLDEAAAAA